METFHHQDDLAPRLFFLVMLSLQTRVASRLSRLQGKPFHTLFILNATPFALANRDLWVLIR